VNRPAAHRQNPKEASSASRKSDRVYKPAAHRQNPKEASSASRKNDRVHKPAVAEDSEEASSVSRKRQRTGESAIVPDSYDEGSAIAVQKSVNNRNIPRKQHSIRDTLRQVEGRRFSGPQKNHKSVLETVREIERPISKSAVSANEQASRDPRTNSRLSKEARHGNASESAVSASEQSLADSRTKKTRTLPWTYTPPVGTRWTRSTKNAASNLRSYDAEHPVPADDETSFPLVSRRTM
jgi:hypothetical protein